MHRFLRLVATTRPRTVRLRLTLLYGGLFAVSGTVLLVITNVLVRSRTGQRKIIKFGYRDGDGPPQGSETGLPDLSDPMAAAQAQASRERAEHMHDLLVQSGIALGIMIVISLVLGWLVAGRVLRPLRSMTATVQQISAHNVHERLAAQGPRDELKDLADTVDGLLGRLETALDAHKRFVANAAHELRTPLTLERALLEETLTDRTASADSFRSTLERLHSLSEQQGELLEALLTLAGSESGPARREALDLSELAGRVLQAPRAEAARVRVESRLEPAPADGDIALAQRLIANLVDNAIHYNSEGGRVEVTTATEAGRAVITVANTGPVIPPEHVNRLFEPFHRFGDRTARGDGHHGLGLSIVRAIAAAHEASLTARARPEGGLVVEVGFPEARELSHPRVKMPA